MNKSELNLCHLIMHGGGGGMLTALFIIGRGLGLILKAVSLFIRQGEMSRESIISVFV